MPPNPPEHNGHWSDHEESCHRCLYNAGAAAESEKLTAALAGMKAIGFEDGPFKGGWHTAIEELEARMAGVPDESEDDDAGR